MMSGNKDKFSKNLKHNQMKKSIIVIFQLLFVHSLFAQMILVDAGLDKKLCVTAQGVVMNGTIGGNPTASGLGASFTYKWETEDRIGNSVFTASYFLNDTTAANPIVVTASISPLKFYLTVTDNNGAQGVDSVTIGFSSFGSLFPNPFYVSAGDSVRISYPIGGGTPPYTYDWYPNYNISDTAAAMPLVWPARDTIYFCTIKDSLNCPATFNTYAQVIVWAVSTKEILKKHLKIYPNPTQDYLTIELDKGKIKHLYITDMSGKVVLRKSKVINHQIDVSHLDVGNYVLIVETEEGHTGSFQILKQ